MNRDHSLTGFSLQSFAASFGGVRPHKEAQHAFNDLNVSHIQLANLVKPHPAVEADQRNPKAGASGAVSTRHRIMPAIINTAAKDRGIEDMLELLFGKWEPLVALSDRIAHVQT
ncbi:hypothetical protein ER13_02020 [Brevundimonas sp. EAKA]|nr:hypothetical protein ER13_02020 [Brevundimonas sp. EAKA]